MKLERRTISTHWSATFSPCRDMSIRFAGNTLFLSYWTKCCAPSLGETNRCRIFGHVQYTSIAILSPRLWEKHRLNGGSEPPPHVQTALANCECHSKRSLQTGGACEQEMKALESGKLNGTAFKPSAAPVKQKELSSGSAGGMAVAQLREVKVARSSSGIPGQLKPTIPSPFGSLVCF